VDTFQARLAASAIPAFMPYPRRPYRT
jgi:hypothetical protein